MSRRALISAAACAFAMAGLCALALVLTSCGPEEVYPDVYLYGEVDGETWSRVGAAVEHMPSSPWPCVREVYISEAGCHLRRSGRTITHAGCYWPDSQVIVTRLAALPHELGHAAAECAYRHPDAAHESDWWPAVDRAGR